MNSRRAVVDSPIPSTSLQKLLTRFVTRPLKPWTDVHRSKPNYSVIFDRTAFEGRRIHAIIFISVARRLGTSDVVAKKEAGAPRARKGGFHKKSFVPWIVESFDGRLAEFEV